ncbi:MAG: PilZ domain-containing protein [Deltaproteobacteria bacterium]|nr:PilZ domain-containing protein [Deltaproteobacteria bacterium]
MKTIIIIGNETVGRDALVDLFLQWQQETTVVTAPETDTAGNIMAEQQIDLMVCDLGTTGDTNLSTLSTLTHIFPYIPCIFLADPEEYQREEVLEKGASIYLKKPVDSGKLLSCARKFLDMGTSGTVKGIPIHSFLQILESEEKTCSLQIDRDNDRGMLYIQDGILIDAETKNLSAEEAAYVILTWEEAIIEIRYFNCRRKKQIHKPLIAVIIEASRLRSELDNLQKKGKAALLHQLPLKHVSTREKHISLDIGAEVKIEFPCIKTPRESTIIGMLKDQFLILSTPPSFSTLEKLISSEHRVIVRYLQEGRLWMFKSRLLNAIDSPSRLLFLEYPAVVHYHELRKTKRTAIFIPCTFHQPNELELYGALTDLSTGGGLCQIKNRPEAELQGIEIGSPAQLRCLLPGTREEQKIGCTVCNMKKDSTATMIGVEFVNLQPHIIETISRYLYSVKT